MAKPNQSAPSEKPTNLVSVVIDVDWYKDQLGRWTKKSRRKADFPRRLKARLVALHYFQIAFDSGQEYTERQVNTAIQRGNIFDMDHVQIRRHLVDYGMLSRSADGRTYSISERYLSLAEWDPVILNQ
ncbi:MAG: DUF2087 domain-containing protein [SAR202 cluster bacterium]|jgi:hypothetical protein|nr:DUF2087 domain-containing protein [SAR202 cluster bacterium]